MIAPIFQFNLSIFVLSFLITEVTSIKILPLRLFISHGGRRIKIHHAYLGFLLAFISSLFGQVALLNVGLGAFFSDIFFEFSKVIKSRFRKILVN